MPHSIKRLAFRRSIKLAFGLTLLSGLPTLIEAPARARSDDSRERASEVTASASTKPSAPSLAPLAAICVGILLAAGLSTGKLGGARR